MKDTSHAEELIDDIHALTIRGEKFGDWIDVVHVGQKNEQRSFPRVPTQPTMSTTYVTGDDYDGSVSSDGKVLQQGRKEVGR